MSTYVCLEAEETEALSRGTYQLRPGTTLALCFYLVVGSSRSYGRVLYTVFSISTCSKPRNCIQKGAWTILQADFLNKIFHPPLLLFYFARGSDTLAPWGCLIILCGQMPVRLASWLLKTSSLKAMAQVLERPAGECECQRPSSQKSLLHVLP